jgi:hypothetical protein
MAADPIFRPLPVRSLRAKSRIFRYNISGRFDYDGETRFVSREEMVQQIMSVFEPAPFRDVRPARA